MQRLAYLDLLLPFTPGSSYPIVWTPGNEPDPVPPNTLRLVVELPDDVDLADLTTGEGGMIRLAPAIAAAAPSSTTPGADPELAAITTLRDFLVELDPAAQARVLAWARDRYGADGGR